jgi:hypothetical protein
MRALAPRPVATTYWIVATCRPYLARTATVAVVVGTVLFAINQLDVVLEGRATNVTWLKIALTYLVPFLVSNYGVLTASRGRPPAGTQADSGKAPPETLDR